MVDIVTPCLFLILVHRLESKVLSITALIVFLFGISVLLKTIPVFILAGSTDIDTALPL